MNVLHRVIWAIDVEADSPAHAAMKAEYYQKEQATGNAHRGSFDVIPCDDGETRIDLGDAEHEEYFDGEEFLA